MAFEHPNGPQRGLDRGDREKLGRIRVNKIASLRPVDIGQNSVAMLEALRAGARGSMLDQATLLDLLSNLQETCQQALAPTCQQALATVQERACTG